MVTKMKLILLDREFNLTPCSSTRFFNLGLVSAIFQVVTAFVYSHFSSTKVLNLSLLFKLVKIILIQLVKSSRLLFNSFIFKRWIRINKFKCILIS